jgi:hypothetical protein
MSGARRGGRRRRERAGDASAGRHYERASSAFYGRLRHRHKLMTFLERGRRGSTCSFEQLAVRRASPMLQRDRNDFSLGEWAYLYAQAALFSIRALRVSAGAAWRVPRRASACGSWACCRDHARELRVHAADPGRSGRDPPGRPRVARADRAAAARFGLDRPWYVQLGLYVRRSCTAISGARLPTRSRSRRSSRNISRRPSN